MDINDPDFDFDSLFNITLDDATLAKIAQLEEEALGITGTPSSKACEVIELSHVDTGVNSTVQPAQSGTVISAPVKRGRGRPRGSKNKKGLLQSSTVAVPDVQKKRPGRPPGTGRHQALTTDKSKVTVEYGKLVVPGVFPARTSDPQAENGLHMSSNLVKQNGTREPSIDIGAEAVQEVSHPTPKPLLRESTKHVNSPFPQVPITPTDDPDRPMLVGQDDDDDELYDGLLMDEEEEGNSDDEDDDPDADDDDDEHNGDTNERPINSKATKSHSRRPLPAWLQSSFVAKVEESRNRGDDRLPQLYREHQTFWFPQPSPFFLLKKSNLTPQMLFNPRFFLWDPMPLCPEGIKCPNCSVKLHRHREIDRPRRCIDINSIFWMIGYRYRCPNCKNPKSHRKTVTFRSWDSRIISSLPRALQLEFPAILSHRSALSKTTFTMMRSCIQNGMGTKQVSTALRMHHLEKYDELYLQYLHTIAQRQLSIWRGTKIQAFPEFFDRSENSYHGYIPSSLWLRDMYDNFMRKHQHEINQHISMLSGDICAIDHSHKITKHIARIDGVQIFTGLLTVTNNFGEIRVCTLVATKSHEQFRVALEQMKISLEMYGNKQPSLFYTDNLADKQFLEEVFPSLRDNIVPIEKYAHLPIFEIPNPPDIHIYIKKTAAAIDQAAQTILDSLPMLNGEISGKIVIGFDTEWNAEAQPYGGVVREQTTAVIQIAHVNVIYILQVGHLLTTNQLPRQLRLLLASPFIIKVGCRVTTDLRILETSCKSNVPFIGGLELGKFAKERNVVSNARISLADLCAITLQKCLKKNVPHRISNQWMDDILSNDQINYAARDAYASLAVYNVLSRLPRPEPLPIIITPHTPVILYHHDNSRIIAHGELSPQSFQKTYDGINITSKRVVVTVTQVLVPGAILNIYKKPLHEFGSPTFNIVVLRSHLRIAPSLQKPLEPSISPVTQPPVTNISQHTVVVDGDSVDAMEFRSGFDTSDEEPFGELLFYGLHAEPNLESTSQRLDEYISDPISAEQGQNILKPVPSEWPDLLRSRVLKDPFHVFNMFYIPRTHGLRVTFARALRDVMFIPNKEDVMRINQWGLTQNPPVTYDKLRVTSPRFIHRHCRRTIPPPEILYPLVHGVIQTFGHLQDAKTRQPLFNMNAWKISNNVLSLIQNGYVSDPPGISLYSQIGVDHKAGNLPIYRCFRGTNFTEGGVHTQLRPRLPTSGASVCHVYSCLLDFILRHNLLVGVRNRTGQLYKGHLSIWLTNEIQECIISLDNTFIQPPQFSGWVNGNLYMPTSEVAGILPIPLAIQNASGMAAYLATHDLKQPHAFLAFMQQTRKPVLPIHSSAERELFRKLLREDPAFNNPQTGPQWKQAVKIWNREADMQKEITYKLIEHLTSYFTEWKTTLNVKESLAISTTARITLLNYIERHHLNDRAPTIPPTTLKQRTITTGFRSLDNTISTPTPTTPASITISPPPPKPHNCASNDRDILSAATEVTAQLCHKRVAELVENSRPVKKVRVRHCAKCGRHDCKGNQRAAWCPHACQDCGKVSCQGRNSKKPHKRCNDGWD